MHNDNDYLKGLGAWIRIAGASLIAAALSLPLIPYTNLKLNAIDKTRVYSIATIELKYLKMALDSCKVNCTDIAKEVETAQANIRGLETEITYTNLRKAHYNDLGKAGCYIGYCLITFGLGLYIPTLRRQLADSYLYRWLKKHASWENPSEQQSNRNTSRLDRRRRKSSAEKS